MEKLTCTSCKASLQPEGERVEFITCIYCRATNVNPKYKPPINHTEQFQKQATQQSLNRPLPERNAQAEKEMEILNSVLTTVSSFAPTGSRSFNRSLRRWKRKGCGCLIAIIFILILVILALMTFILGG